MASEGGDSDPVAIAETLSIPLGMTSVGIPDIDIYNEVCKRVKEKKQILVRNADTIHDFGGERGQVGDDGHEYARIKRLIVAEKTALQTRGDEYNEILDKYKNLTQGSEFEGTMFQNLLPPQKTFVYGNTPGVPSVEHTNILIKTDTIDDVNKAIQIKNDIYRFLWPETVSGSNPPGTYEFKIMADVGPGKEIKKIATLSISDSSVKIRVRVTPESVMDSGSTYNTNDDKILPGFGEFTPSPLDGKWHPTPVFSLPYVRIKTETRTGYGKDNPKAFDVIIQDRIGNQLKIPHDKYDSGPGVNYIARNVAGEPVDDDIKAGMLPFYDLIRNRDYIDNAKSIGFLNSDGTLTDLGKNMGYDLKREGDQSQAIAVLMSYLAGEKVVLATKDRMLALFMILMRGPVIHFSKGETKIYRGEGLNLTDEQKRRILISDINDIITPITDLKERDEILRITGQCHKYIKAAITEYRRKPGRLLNIPHTLLIKSLENMRDRIDNFDELYTYFFSQRDNILKTVGDLYRKDLSELREIRKRIIGPLSDITVKLASVTAAIEKLKGIKYPLNELDLGEYGYIDVPAINRLNKLLKRFMDNAKIGFRSEKNFHDKFKEPIVSNFQIVYSRLTDKRSLTDTESLLSSLTSSPNKEVLDILSKKPVVDDDTETVVTVGQESSDEERVSLEAAVSGTPPLPEVADIDTITDIHSSYDFCVIVVAVLYSTIYPLIMSGKKPTEDILRQVGGAKGMILENPDRRRSQFHNKRVSRADRQDAATMLRREKMAAMRMKRRRKQKDVTKIQEIFNEAESTLEFKIMSLEDELPAGLPTDISSRYTRVIEILRDFHSELLEKGPVISLRILHTMRGILFEGEPKGLVYDNLYDIDKLPDVLNVLFAYSVKSAIPASAADVAAASATSSAATGYGRKSMPSQTKRRSRKCPRGTIRRKAYKTKRGVTVRSSCIKDRGLPGKGKRLFTLKKGELGKYGYSLKQDREKRRVALNKARKELSHATLVRKINALAILMKNTRPDYSRRARADVKWLGKMRT
jgi:hypothetical protein